MSTPAPPVFDFAVRSFSPRELRAVLQIEAACAPTPDNAWQERDFHQVLMRPRHYGAMVTLGKRTVVGFVVFEALNRSYAVLNLAVHPRYQRRGAGRVLISWLCDQAQQSGRKKVRLEVREGNLPAQLFLRRMRFQAVEVLRGYYGDSKEDAYRFEWCSER